MKILVVIFFFFFVLDLTALDTGNFSCGVKIGDDGNVTEEGSRAAVLVLGTHTATIISVKVGWPLLPSFIRRLVCYWQLPPSRLVKEFLEF